MLLGNRIVPDDAMRTILCRRSTLIIDDVQGRCASGSGDIDNPCGANGLLVPACTLPQGFAAMSAYGNNADGCYAAAMYR